MHMQGRCMRCIVSICIAMIKCIIGLGSLETYVYMYICIYISTELVFSCSIVTHVFYKLIFINIVHHNINNNNNNNNNISKMTFQCRFCHIFQVGVLHPKNDRLFSCENCFSTISVDEVLRPVTSKRPLSSGKAALGPTTSQSLLQRPLLSDSGTESSGSSTHSQSSRLSYADAGTLCIYIYIYMCVYICTYYICFST